MPRPSTLFVGRRSAVTEVRGLIAGEALVTLVGPPGCGKTRLAVEVASAEQERGRWAVTFVELAPLGDARLVAHSVGVALGLRQQAGEPMEDTVVEALRTSPPRLLLLDNCEHVLDAAGSLARRVTEACPAVRLLVTSRARLGLEAEQVWAVPTLALPAAADLFVDRARLVAGPGVAPDGDETSRRTITDICRYLDGVPLAIELAAAWTRMLSLPEIAERVDHALLLRSSGVARRRSAPDGAEWDPRHETMAATVEWSYRLLAPQHQALFRQLSVFAGGFDLEAAEAVLPPDADVLAGLVHLVDHSLVLTDRRADAPMRYRLLEPVRQFALDALRRAEPQALGEGPPREGEDALRLRHAEHFHTLARRSEPFGIRGVSPPLPFARAVEDEANLLAAAEWARRRPDDLALRLCVAYAPFFEFRGPLVDGRTWLEAALERGTEDPDLRLAALWSAGKLAWRHGDQDGARALLEKGVAAGTEAEDPWWVAHMQARLALVALSAGDADEAVALCDDAVEAFARTTDQVGMLWSLMVRGWARYMERNVTDGDADMRAALRANRQVRNHTASAQGYFGLAYGAFLAGDTPAQRAHLVSALSEMRQAGGCVEESDWLGCAGALAAREGRLHTALRVIGGAMAFGRRASSRFPARIAAPIEHLVLELVETVGGPVAGRLLADGEALGLDELVTEALGGPTGDERGRLTPRESQVAQLVGRGLTNVEVAEQLGISRRTVETHVDHVKQKLGVTSRQQVMAWALLEFSS